MDPQKEIKKKKEGERYIPNSHMKMFTYFTPFNKIIN